MKLRFKSISASTWSDLETLFGDKGACGGCWCMFWRLENKDYRAGQVNQGKANRDRFRKLVVSKKVNGLIAYGDIEGRTEPVGWVSFDKRTDYVRLNAAPSLKCEDAAEVWSIPCFYIRPGLRGKGIASGLLAEAVKVLRAKGAKTIEGYPVITKSRKKLPAAFAWTGTTALFDKCGFKRADKKAKGKVRVRIKK